MFSHMRPHGLIQKQITKRTLLRPLAGLSLLIGLILPACGALSPPSTTVLTEATSTPIAATAQTEVPAAAPATDPAATPAHITEGNGTTTNALGQAAYVRAGVLYIQDDGGNAVPVDDCSAGNCFIYHLDWSSTGTHLLYYIGSYDGSVPHQIRIADATGANQTVAQPPAYVQPAGWSWDGTPDSLEATVMPSSASPELVFYGKQTGTIYYTTLEIIDRIDLVEQASQWMDQSINVYPSFDVTQASVVALNPSTGAGTILYANDATAYAYAHVKELAHGGVIFSRVEGNAQLQAAVESETLTADNWRDYLPTVDLLYIAPDSNEATLLSTSIAQYTTAN